MKKFYTLAIAFMSMFGVANAETVTFSADYQPSGLFGLGDPILLGKYEVETSEGLTFSLYGIEQREDAGGFFSGSRCPYWIDKQPDKNSNTFASIKVSGLEEGQSINMTVSISAACKAAFSPVHSCSIVSSSDGARERIFNHAFRLGFNDYSFSTTNFTNDDEILFANGGGACGFDKITITYDVIEDKSVKVTPEHEVVFSGNWTAGQISEVVQGPLSYIEINGDDIETVVVEPGKYGVIDVTGVTGNLNMRPTINTVNKNTIIAVNPGQEISNWINVLVMDEQDPYVENLVITDPIQEEDTQSSSSYRDEDCGWYCTRTFTAKNATYTRPMSFSYGSVVLPFAYNVKGQSHQIETIIDVNTATAEITSARVLDRDMIAPCVPVMVWSETPQTVVITAEDAKVSGPQSRAASNFIGTMTETTIGEGQYFVAQDKFHNAGAYGEIIVKPFRAWIEAGSEAAVKAFTINSESATAIKSVETTTAAPAYNLQGVRVAPNAKGFVIVNGKKTYNK